MECNKQSPLRVPMYIMSVNTYPYSSVPACVPPSVCMHTFMLERRWTSVPVGPGCHHHHESPPPPMPYVLLSLLCHPRMMNVLNACERLCLRNGSESGNHGKQYAMPRSRACSSQTSTFDTHIVHRHHSQIATTKAATKERKVQDMGILAVLSGQVFLPNTRPKGDQV